MNKDGIKKIEIMFTPKDPTEKGVSQHGYAILRPGMEFGIIQNMDTVIGSPVSKALHIMIKHYGAEVDTIIEAIDNEAFEEMIVNKEPFSAAAVRQTVTDMKIRETIEKTDKANYEEFRKAMEREMRTGQKSRPVAKGKLVNKNGESLSPGM
jgi:hypothetical protein